MSWDEEKRNEMELPFVVKNLGFRGEESRGDIARGNRYDRYDWLTASILKLDSIFLFSCDHHTTLTL